MVKNYVSDNPFGLMKKIKKLKVLLKAVVFIMVMVFVMQGCEPEIVEFDNSQKYSVRNISINNIDKKEEFLNILQEIKNKYSKKNLEKNINSTDGLFTINTDLIKVTSDDVYTNYTFLIERDSNDTLIYENLVILTNNYNNEKSLKIFKFNKTDEFVNIYNLDQNAINLDSLNIDKQVAYIFGHGITVPDCVDVIYLPCDGDGDADGHQAVKGYCHGSATILDFSHCDLDGGGIELSTGAYNSNGPDSGGGVCCGQTSSGSTTNIGDPYIHGGVATLTPEESGEVDFEDQIIIELSFLNNECLSDVYSDMKDNSTSFKDYLQNFMGETPVSHLRFKYDENFGNNQPNYTTALAITSPPQNYVIDITFNGDSNLTSSIHNKPKLIIAVAFIHEMIHAEIFRKMLSAASQGDLVTTGMTQQQQIDFVLNLRNDFPGLYDYYVDRWRNDWGHQVMAQHYVDIIKNALAEYDDNAHSQETYQAIAWMGLYDTIAWNNLTPIEQTTLETNFNTFIQNDTDICD